MDFWQQTDRENIHHAYIIEGPVDVMLPRLYIFLDSLKFIKENNPDFSVRTFGTFGIDDARDLKKADAEKTLVAGYRIFVITLTAITREAEHALLKLLEEPSVGTHFFILAPTAHMFLPTILSRVQVVHSDQNLAVSAADAETFLKSTRAERIEYIGKFITRYKNTEDGEDVKSAALKLVSGIEKILSQKLRTKPETVNTLKKVDQARSYLVDRGASVKIILEYLALVL